MGTKNLDDHYGATAQAVRILGNTPPNIVTKAATRIAADTAKGVCRALNIPVTIANAFECCTEADVDSESESLYVLAASLALREDL